MPLLLPHLALAAALLFPFAQETSPQTAGQTSPQGAAAAPRPTLNHTLVFIDPAHGGDDTGAHLGGDLLEKDVTLALANRLRFQLSALGLNVLDTRESDPAPATPGAPPPAPPPTPDQRAGLANHVHPFACIILHATAAGSGVHVITSAVSAPDDNSSPYPTAPASSLIPWGSAEAASLPQSRRLAAELATALSRAGLPVHTSRAAIRPLDNVTCPAVLIELAPLSPSSPASDPGYQSRVAQTVATALLFWRGHAEPDLPATTSALAPAGSQP